MNTGKSKPDFGRVVGELSQDLGVSEEDLVRGLAALSGVVKGVRGYSSYLERRVKALGTSGKKYLHDSKKDFRRTRKATRG